MFVVFRVFCWTWGGSYHICFSFADPPAQCLASVWIIWSHLRHRTIGFSCLFIFALPTPSSAESRGGDHGTLFTHNVARNWV